MPALSKEAIEGLLQPYILATNADRVSAELLLKLSEYLELLLRWNGRTNLSAIRDPEQIVQRHFGESLFAAQCLERRVNPVASILDLGSGAGFPGIPLQLWQPQWRVSLAESQSKKAAFLREAVRHLAVSASVWGARAEDLPSGSGFDAVALRAVDRMRAMEALGARLVLQGGVLMLLTSDPGDGAGQEAISMPERVGSYVVFHAKC